MPELSASSSHASSDGAVQVDFSEVVEGGASDQEEGPDKEAPLTADRPPPPPPQVREFACCGSCWSRPELHAHAHSKHHASCPASQRIQLPSSCAVTSASAKRAALLPLS